MRDLSRMQRRAVKRAITRGKRLRDPRLVRGLAELARWYRDHSLAASLRWVAIALPPALVVGPLVGGRLGAHPANVALAVVLGVLAAELVANRPLRRRQARQALARHGLDGANRHATGSGGARR